MPDDSTVTEEDLPQIAEKLYSLIISAPDRLTNLPPEVLSRVVAEHDWPKGGFPRRPQLPRRSDPLQKSI
jgi:hypothetical protein